MRLLSPVVFWLLAVWPASAQSPALPVEIDARLFEVFDADYLARLRDEQPALLLRWNFYLDNAFTISDLPAEKGDAGAWPVVRVTDPARINILLLEKEQGLRRDWDKPVYYRIAGSQKVLMYWPGREFNRRFQQWLSKK